MTTNMKKSTRQIKCADTAPIDLIALEDWDIEALKNDIPLLRAAFVYEYFRQSRKFQDLVTRYRLVLDRVDDGFKLSAPKVGTKEGIGSIFHRWQYAFEPFRDQAEAILSGSGFSHDIIATIMLLAQLREYPSKSAFEIDRGKLLGLVSESGARHETSVLDHADQSHWFAMSDAQPGIDYHLSGTIKAAAHESFFPLVVDWRRPNKKILADLKQQVIERRPIAYLNYAEKSDEQSPLWSRASGLAGFTPASALTWLRVLRRFEHCGNDWKRYLSAFESKAKREQLSLNRTARHKSSLDSWRRQLRKDCLNARNLIEWFESGAISSLCRADFR